MITMRTPLVHFLSILCLATLSILCLATLVSCDNGVLNFPQPAPAAVRVVNVTQDVATLGVVIEGSTNMLVNRGDASSFESVTAGRPVSFVFKDGDIVLRRDTLFYTLGGNARVILFAKGTKTNLVEFRQAIQDTNVSGSPMAFVRFTHMAEFVNRAEFVELWTDAGQKVFTDLFLPGISSPTYAQLTPGTHSFVLREEGTGAELARLSNVSLSAGISYMLYTFDAAPTAIDSIAMNIVY